MRFFNYSLLTILVLLSLFACNDGTTSGEPVDNAPDDSTVFNPLMSLKIGNSWDYQETNYNPDGSLLENPTSGKLIILRDTVIGGVKAFLLGAENGNISGAYANKADGLYGWSPHDGNKTLNLYVKYPIVKGETYHVTVNPDHENSGMTVVVEETNVEVTVPAGTFKCVKIKTKFNDSDVWDVMYYAKNIGLIKGEFMDYEEEGSPIYLASKTELINKNF